MKKRPRGARPFLSVHIATKLVTPPYPKLQRKSARDGARTPLDEVPREERAVGRRPRWVRVEIPRDRGHREVQEADGRAQRRPPERVDREAERRRERRRENGRHAPVADPFRAPLVRDQAGHVGRGRRQEARPEEAVEEDENDEDLPPRREGIGDGEAGDRACLRRGASGGVRSGPRALRSAGPRAPTRTSGAPGRGRPRSSTLPSRGSGTERSGEAGRGKGRP